MRARRYTLVIADRTTGVLRHVTLSLRPALAIVTLLFSLPVLIGLGARWSAVSEIEVLRSSNATLELENQSYRAATEELTTQIQSLQTAVSDLGSLSAIDPQSARAVERLPAVMRSRAAGGATLASGTPDVTSVITSSLAASPDDTFGVLRNLLEGLEGRLSTVRRDVERRQALANATPSIWPVFGWLSGGFGQRRDPFTGDPGFHRGLDISADRAEPVYATASGTVETAGYTGDYGNLIVINHSFGLATRYGHLSRFTVKVGDRVSRGDVIGYVGSTGRATGSHLHYEVLANGRIVNPLRLLTSKPR
jgi:murein DD-endopeptidase MepM/ murein hydrolase activator NlpD